MSYTIRAKMCGMSLSMGDIAYEWFTFPKNDSWTEFWCIGAVAPIGNVVMIFCQDPNVKKELVDDFIEVLRTKHAISFTDKFNRITYPADYKPGTYGEFAFNKKGKPPTIDHAKNENAHQVIASPYPPPK